MSICFGAPTASYVKSRLDDDGVVLMNFANIPASRLFNEWFTVYFSSKRYHSRVGNIPTTVPRLKYLVQRYRDIWVISGKNEIAPIEVRDFFQQHFQKVYSTPVGDVYHVSPKAQDTLFVSSYFIGDNRYRVPVGLKEGTTVTMPAMLPAGDAITIPLNFETPGNYEIVVPVQFDPQALEIKINGGVVNPVVKRLRYPTEQTNYIGILHFSQTRMPDVTLRCNVDVRGNSSVIVLRNKSSDRMMIEPLQIAMSKDSVIAQIQNRANFNFGGRIRLLGYNMSPANGVKLGENVTLTYYWECLRHMKIDYRVCVRIDRVSPYLRIGDVDHMPQSGLKMTSTWKPGEIIKEEYAFRMPVVPMGSYNANVFIGHFYTDVWYSRDLVVPDAYPLGSTYYPRPFEIISE